MDFLRRQLQFRDYRFGLPALVVAALYLALVLVSLAYIVWYQANPDPDEVGATFEALPAIVLTMPTSMLLLPVLGWVGYVTPLLGIAVLLLAGLVQAFLIYVLLRWRRRPETSAPAPVVTATA